MEKARFIELDAGPRYWEDATLNGEEDHEGKMPFSDGERWKPVIDLMAGRIIDWPTGYEAAVHYKVCDDGEYWLLDEEKKRIAKWRGYYVPNRFLCVGDNGFGDYIIFSVNQAGEIAGWKTPDIDPEQWVLV